MNMVAFGKKVVKFRIPILIISILLLIPAGLGYVNTRVNYDVLTYLPEDIETMQGQDILVKDFGTGAFSMFIVDGMEDKKVSALKAKIENVEHVQKVLWYDSLADISMPKSMIPKDVYEVFNSDTGTMMAIFFDEGTSSDGTMEAIGEIRKLAGKQCFLSGMSAIVMILVDSSVESADVAKMIDKMDDIDGVKWALGLDALIGPAIPQDMIPNSVTDMLKNDKYQLLLVNSEYKVASDELNDQIKDLNKILHKYDKGGMLIGEGPLTADLIDITDTDFKTVSMVSIGIIFVIILILFKSISLPVILVGVIEFAIFVNMGIPYYTGTKLPFVASIVIGTIQLGSTVDYAILMTTRYKRERNHGAEKYDAITTAHRASAQSIMVSALSFFAATIGVGLYSNIDMISSLCILMARGAIISMIVVIFVLPSMFMVFDKVIVKTSKGFLPVK